MLTDKFLRVMTDQSITATGQVSASSIDLQDAGREIGTGDRLQFHVTLGAVNFAGTATEVWFEAIVASDAALTANLASVGAIRCTVALLNAAITAQRPGFRVIVPIAEQLIINAAAAPVLDYSAPGWNAQQRYLGLRISTVTGTVTALTIAAAYLMPEGSDSTLKNYRSGFTFPTGG